MRYLLFATFMFFSKLSNSQTLISILPDSTIKFFTDLDKKFHRERCAEGLQLLIDDSSKNIIAEFHIRNCRLNGTYRRFYDNHMIMEMGNYVDSGKEGDFYYWEENGFLQRKEIWRKNKLIKVAKYKK